MNTAVPPLASTASGPHISSCGAVGSRRAPVLLRLSALPASPPSDPPSHTATVQEMAPPPASHASSAITSPEHEPLARESASRNRSSHEHGSREPSPRERSSSRHERRESKERQPAALSQWILGGCMLAAGIAGFLVLSGDWGGATDAPPADGWSRRADEKPADSPSFSQPQFAESPPITVHRESTASSQPERHWSNPAEGEITPALAQQQTPTPPNWMGSDSLASHSADATPTPATTPEASYPRTDQGAGSTAVNGPASMNPAPTTSNVPLAPPANSAPSLSAPQVSTPTMPATPNYPDTGAAALGSLTPAASAASGGYPSTGYTATPVPGGVTDYGPAARMGMHDTGVPSGYPTTSTSSPSFPTSGGATFGSSPNDTPPPAMSPRYERIR